ncbi:AsmA family protein [uncultured Pseudodesulfovibrio sp.]|uniref:AsmA family protein n=1 Tax=uncultured Pseudodesulfovibrio sp. TaxID=2035858 RepID=UPI0029C7DA2F|nr:AsmA family protein [uncultured Pseudodesulfovibrio sp.]
MNKAVKFSMIGLGAAAALFVAALIFFAFTFDLNDYKARISEVVQDETGRTLKFDGDLSLSFFPKIGVELGALSLSNAEGFGKKPMVQTVSAHVSVRVLPLLSGQIQFDVLELDGLTLNLSRDKHGKSNWDDLVGHKDTGKAEAGEDDGGFSLDVDGVKLTNARLFWDDRKTDTKFILRGMNLVTGYSAEGTPFPVDINLDFECSKPEATGTLTLTGQSSLDLARRQYGHMETKIALAAKGADIPGGDVDASLDLQSMLLDFNTERAKITGLTVSAYGATVNMDGTLEGITDGLKKLAAKVDVPSFDAREALRQMGVTATETADPKVLTKVGGTADLIYTPGQLHVKALDAALDDTTISGRGRMKNNHGSQFYFARLALGAIDLDRYLPPDHEAKTGEAEKNGTDENVRIIDSELLRQLDLDVETTAEAVRIDGVWLKNVKAVSKARHGLVRLSPVSADLYGGKLSTGITVNAMTKYPKTDVIVGIDKVDVGALSQDALGDRSYEGLLNFNGAISCEGERLPVMLRSMNGKLSFHLANGVFPGVDLFSMAKKTHESKGKEGTVESSKTDSTKFGSISGTGVITAGILRNRDLAVKAPGLRADGNGSVALPTRKLDYLLKVKLVPTSEGQGGKDSDEMFGVMVPIRVAGTIENPRYWVSITEYVKALGGAVIGTAGSVIKGVTGAIFGIGKALDKSSGNKTKE